MLLCRFVVWFVSFSVISGTWCPACGVGGVAICYAVFLALLSGLLVFSVMCFRFCIFCVGALFSCMLCVLFVVVFFVSLHCSVLRFFYGTLGVFSVVVFCILCVFCICLR